MSGRFSVGFEVSQIVPEKHLALAVLERSVWDLVQDGPLSSRAWLDDAFAFLYGEKEREHRLMWCGLLNDDAETVEKWVQEWGLQVLAGEVKKSTKSHATRKKYSYAKV